MFYISQDAFTIIYVHMLTPVKQEHPQYFRHFLLVHKYGMMQRRAITPC